MADSVVAASLTLDGSQANQSVKSFKTLLREANQELLATSSRFGETSKEAAEAAKKVAGLKDQLGDAKKLTDAFNPDEKFKALGNTLQVVTGGFTALTGTMALFGGESKEVEKALLKVQAAMAVTQGVNTLLEGVDVFKTLGSQIKNASVVQKVFAASTVLAGGAMKFFGGATDTSSKSFKLLRGAIIGTGIGALVVALGFVINNFDSIKKVIERLIGPLKGITDFFGKLINSVTDFVGITSEAERALDRLTKSTQLNNEESERRIKKLTAQGGQEREIAKERERSVNRELALLEQAKKTKGKLTDEEIKQQKDLAAEIDIIHIEEHKRLDKITEEANKKAQDKAKQHGDMLKQIKNQSEQELEKLRGDNAVAEIKNENDRAVERIKIDYETEKKRIEALEISSALRISLLQEIKKKEQLALEDLAKQQYDLMQKGYEDTVAKIRALDEEEQKAVGDRMVQHLEDRKKEVQAQQELATELRSSRQSDTQNQLDDLFLWYAKRYEIVETGSKEEVALTEEYERRKSAVVKNESMLRMSLISSMLGRAADIFGKQTAAGKVLAIASATIDTYQAANSALKANYGIFGPAAQIARFVAVGTTIAAGLKNVREIAKVKVPGAGGAVPSISNEASAPLSPQSIAPQVTATQLPQDQINQIGNFTSRAYVVEADIKDNSERAARLNRAARLGG